MVTVKKLLLILLCVALSDTVRAAAPQVVLGPGVGAANFRVPYHIAANRTLSRDTVYVMTGWTFVDSTYTLTIQSGTLLRGDSASGGTIVIKRGARINAVGTPTQPIVFTSNKPAGSRTPGDWGGVILLGSATTNKPTTQQIEGGFGTIANSDAMYGGSNDADNSGVMQYVRIEFAGIAFATDNEINGLTLGGVGSGTTLDHIQVSFSNDDSFEWFGGTAQMKYIVAWQGLDDDIDTDFGFNGKLQFVYSKRNPNIFDASASSNSNGFESDNEGTSPYSALPRTKARVSNVTLIGPAMDSVFANSMSVKFERSAMLRRATELSIYNSVMVGWKLGIILKDTLTQRAAMNDNLQIRHTSLAAPREMVVLGSSPSTPNITGFDPVAWYTTAGWGNNGSTRRQSLDVGLTSAAFNLDATNNPVPTAGSELATAGTAFDGRLTGDAFFSNVSYRGAFDPSLPMNQQWTAGWTNFDPQITPYVTDVKEVGGGIPSTFELSQNYPNPFNPSTVIRFSVPSAGQATLVVFNMIGQEVARLVDGELTAGNYETEFNASRLSSGTYIYRLTSTGHTQVRKMLLLK